MTNISKLFSPNVELQEFNTKNISHIPSFGSIIYTVFLDIFFRAKTHSVLALSAPTKDPTLIDAVMLC